MPKLIILGTSSAVPNAHHDNAHLAVVGDTSLLLIDTGTSPTVRLAEAGFDLLDLTDVLITHFHPDHAAGLPSLLMNSWLMGRIKPLDLYGLEETLLRIQKNMDLYAWENWPNFYPLNQHTLPADNKNLAFENSDIKVWTSPVRHIIPNVGVKIESKLTGKTIVYSSDTEPCPELIQLAEGADILIHDASGPGLGHTSAAQAGEIARSAGVRNLFLIHYLTKGVDFLTLIGQASETFHGPVILTQDFMEMEF
jgi:ribonuclease Z